LPTILIGMPSGLRLTICRLTVWVVCSAQSQPSKLMSVSDVPCGMILMVTSASGRLSILSWEVAGGIAVLPTMVRASLARTPVN